MNSGDSDGKKTTSTEDIFNYINNSGERDHPSSNKPNAHIPPIATSATQAAKPKCILRPVPCTTPAEQAKRKGVK